jgi:hypothetical protein
MAFLADDPEPDHEDFSSYVNKASNTVPNLRDHGRAGRNGGQTSGVNG